MQIELAFCPPLPGNSMLAGGWSIPSIHYYEYHQLLSSSTKKLKTHRSVYTLTTKRDINCVWPVFSIWNVQWVGVFHQEVNNHAEFPEMLSINGIISSTKSISTCTNSRTCIRKDFSLSFEQLSSMT